ncbi:DUF3027 domain-containing protein [Kocuria sp. p3-SID1433]|uniref:DUF3027 domain-containing protein n=1 Tax=unclassified Kocuria TaxID=2649579 RepID=UPI0021A8A73F|nr:MULTISPECIES: DUF3027 domain-containing protein [unclassified Kocuria]MCT1601491.1 DUF3027 domain-containing protein [Kocuria sp. p3-SID1428]MCT2179350.1 DUF3027 domain-containing protein [Kocuria sp. p3-SID1433]
MSEQTTTTHEPAPKEPASTQDAESESPAEALSAASQPPAADAQLAAQKELALEALRELVPAEQIGEGHRVRAEGELVLTHLFPALARGYRGWEWYVTLTRVPGSEWATVCESGMLPGEDALLAPEWVPWSERVLEADHEDIEDGAQDHGGAGHADLEQDDREAADQGGDDAAQQAHEHGAAAEDSADGAQADPEQAPGIDPAP